MPHDWFTEFDRSVCEGEHPAVNGVCSEKKTGDEGLLTNLLGNTILGDLLGMESIPKCGVCGCSLAGLDMADTPPSECIRREFHREDQ